MTQVSNKRRHIQLIIRYSYFRVRSDTSTLRDKSALFLCVCVRARGFVCVRMAIYINKISRERSFIAYNSQYVRVKMYILPYCALTFVISNCDFLSRGRAQEMPRKKKVVDCAHFYDKCATLFKESENGNLVLPLLFLLLLLVHHVSSLSP